jgi:hypothetical protein
MHAADWANMLTMRRLAGVLAVLALVAAGCGGTTADIGSSASDLIPASAPAFIAVDTDPSSDQWQTVMKLADKFPDKQKGINRIKAELRKDPGVEWEKDVKPALGPEFDVAWLDFEHNGENFVMLTQPKDESAFKQLVDKANKSEDNPDDRMTYDTFQGWSLLAKNQATIDRFKQASKSATRTLSDEPNFKKSMDRLGGDSIVRAYVNGDAVMDLIRRYGGAEIQPYVNKVGTLDWIAFRSGVKDNGVGLDAIVHGTPGKWFKGLRASEGFSPKLTDEVPQNALLYWTFHGAKGMISGLTKNSFFNTPELRPYHQVFRELDTLLQGENALYVRPGNGHTPDVPFTIPEVTFVAAPGKGVNGAGILDRMLMRELGALPDDTNIAGAKARKLAEGGNVGLYYANVDGKLVVTDLPAGIRGIKNGGKSLSDSDAYKDTADASGLPDKSQGFFYVNIHSSIPLAEKLAQERIPNDIRRNLKPLDSAVEYVATRTHEFQISFFLLLK